MLDCFLPFFIGDTGTKQDVTYVYFVSLAVDVLKNMEEDDVVIEMTSSVSPCVIKGKNSNNAKYLVLPVRLVR